MDGVGAAQRVSAEQVVHAAMDDVVDGDAMDVQSSRNVFCA